MDKDTVFILGAGFTYAFCDRAPLLNWEISPFIKELSEKYQKFPNISKIISSIRIDELGRTNIEMLLSRLYSGMPYDATHLSNSERGVLYKDVFDYFFNILRAVQVDDSKQVALGQFAKFVIEREITCITFNYDTLLDKALWEFKRSNAALEKFKWHPDGGYGFFCRPVEVLINNAHAVVKDPCNWLLKLHGSLNWGIKKGSQRPYPLDALIHNEAWRGPLMSGPFELTTEDIDIHLETTPFIVPPVLDKSVLTDQPILKVVWENAYNKLKTAKKVIFIGYSLPKTDIAASYLLKEAILDYNKIGIEVVTSVDDKQKKIDAYRDIFPELRDDQFKFNGALDWIQHNCN